MTTVRVTADHLARGERLAAGRCPLALAVAEALPGSQPVVSGQWVWTWRGGRRVRHDLPEDVAERVRGYDRAGQMEPFEFALAEGA